MLQIGDKMPAFSVTDETGKVSMGTLRKTFVFNEDGFLDRIIEKVDTKNHAGQLLGQTGDE